MEFVIAKYSWTLLSGLCSNEDSITSKPHFTYLLNADSDVYLLCVGWDTLKSGMRSIRYSS